MIVGFDLWGTLIKSNPLFVESKKILFEQHFSQINSEKFLEAQKNVKLYLDKLTAMTGYQSDISTRQSLLLHYLGLDINNSYHQKKMSHFLDDYQKLFELFPPLPYCNDSQEWYEQIRDLAITDRFILVSNTVFNGRTSFRGAIDKLYYYDDLATSDVMGVSKPSKGIYDGKIDIFIGDTPETDGIYAKAIGAEFFQINTNNKTIKDAYEYIKSSANR